jgi:hypothetical protein
MAAIASTTTPTTLLQRLPDGFVEVGLRGEFSHPHWLAYLLRGLSEGQVSLVSGRAVQSDTLEWDARIVLDFRPSQLQPEKLDYVTLAHQRMEMATLAAPQLGSFRIARRSDLQLEVHLEAPDQVGFLGRLLTRVSSLGLFPSEMEIATVGGRIKDRLVLRGILNKAPTDTVQKSLEAMFRLMTTSARLEASGAIAPASIARTL